MRYKLTIELLSDTCVGSGDSMSSIVDMEIAYDSYGIPAIQGRRMKGLFREAAEELNEFGMISDREIKYIFGCAGTDEGNIIFPNLFPADYEAVRQLILEAKRDSVWKNYVRRKNVTDYYTSIRKQTALDEDGIARENSLRTIRVVRKGIVFEGKIDIDGDNVERIAEVLEKCAGMIRHIGINRTRGMGNVMCRLCPDANDSSDNDENAAADTDYNTEETGVLPIRIRLKQPCILSNNYIAGNIIKGIYAAAYARQYGTENTYSDEVFRQLFVANDVKYGYCWPLYDEKIYYPMPFSILKEKKSDKDQFYDLTGYLSDKLEEALTDKEGFGEQYCRIEGNEISLFVPERGGAYHHQRPKDRSLGHAFKDKDRSEGQLYMQEYICEEQEFQGEIWGPSEALAKLKDLLPNDSECHIGASRSAQYGKAAILYLDTEEEDEDEGDMDHIVLTFLSPMVAVDEYGNESTSARDVLRMVLPGNEKNIAAYQIHEYCKEETLSGYHSKWRMPLIQRKVLKPGSEIVIDGMTIDKDRISEIERKAYGFYQEEGYGRIRINWHGQHSSGRYSTAQKYISMERIRWEKLNFAQKSYLDMCLKDLLAGCYEGDTDCMMKIRKKLEAVPNSHSLSVLLRICQTSDSFEQFEAQLKKAAEKVTTKSNDWYKDIHDILFEKDNNGNTEEKNNFIREGIDKISRMGIHYSWREPLKKILEEQSFGLFKSLLVPMLQDTRLKLALKNGRKQRGAGNE